jgi:hypothetical protein
VYRKLQHAGALALGESGQQHDFPIGKFERVAMRGHRLLVDLPEYGSTIRELFARPGKSFLVTLFLEPAEKTPSSHDEAIRKGDLGAGQKANGRIGRFQRSETARSCTKIARYQHVADNGRTCFYVVEAVVAHSGRSCFDACFNVKTRQAVGLFRSVPCPRCVRFSRCVGVSGANRRAADAPLVPQPGREAREVVRPAAPDVVAFVDSVGLSGAFAAGGTSAI